MACHTCENCGCKVYNGHCVNCHEETYIMKQDMENDEHVDFSEKFTDKLAEQQKEAIKVLKNQKNNRRI